MRSPGHKNVHGAGGNCEAREILALVGDKWSVYVVAVLSQGARRFSELRRTIDGISQRMLTLTLRGLERDGLVTRKVYATVPARVEYALTPLGETLLEPVQALASWAGQHRAEIQQARDRFDKRARRRETRGDGKHAPPS